MDNIYKYLTKSKKIKLLNNQHFHSNKKILNYFQSLNKKSLRVKIIDKWIVIEVKNIKFKYIRQLKLNKLYKLR